MIERRLATRTLSVLAIATACALSLVTGAGAAPVTVDPGSVLSSGKPITGTGENLPSLQATSPWNIGSYAAAQVESYYTSGEASADQTSVSRAALRWTRSWVQRVCGGSKPAVVRTCKAAAVFDIDETLLSNVPVLAAATPAFTYEPAAADAAVQNCSTPAIDPVKSLFVSLRRLGVTAFIVTGRPESERAATSACLTKVGITGYKALILKPSGNTQSAGARKADQRRELIAQGWKIGPSIGDQISDMSYGSLAHGFLLPNPMYFIP
jgi:predicted secreted acid phosphatase